MLKVTVELIPHGIEAHKRLLGEAYIANDGQAEDRSNIGNYTFKFLKSPEYAAAPGVWRQGHVEGFPRTKLGPWDLLYRCLKEAVAARNRS